MQLSRIKKLDLREAWSHEANDFTKWLAEPENISLLSEEIGVDINVIKTEAPVGRFNVDILAEEAETEEKIIIENQLEYTDHSHLGQLITYASGVDAKYIIWIVRDVREEHRQAIDWLNEHTDGDVNFFLILIEVWKIDESNPAPNFVIVSKPNDWKRVMSQSSERCKSNGNETFYLDFWTGFEEFVKDGGSNLIITGKCRSNGWINLKRQKSHYVGFTVGTAGGKLKYVSCTISVFENEELFNKLLESKPEIEKELGLEGLLKWTNEIGDKKNCVVARVKLECSIEEQTSWPKYYAWLVEVGEKFTDVFSKI